MREGDKTKIGPFHYLLACSTIVLFVMFTVGKDQNNSTLMKIPLSLASVFKRTGVNDLQL